jgi:hypothetical protein
MARALLLALLLVSLSVAGYSVVFNETQVYTRHYTPIMCGNSSSLTVWRELAVYNITTVEAGVSRTRFYSTITLFLRNDQASPLRDFFLKEHVPDSVAQLPAELLNFTVVPNAFEKGSVVVSWLFDNIEPGETKVVSYTVEKELDEDVLDEFESPRVVAAGVDLPESSGAEQGSTAPDYTPVALMALVAVMGLGIYFLSRR